MIEIKTHSKNRQPSENCGGLQIKDGGMSANTRRTLATNKEIVIPDGKHIRQVDIKTLQPHGTGTLGQYDKTSVRVNFQDNHIIAQIDATTGQVKSTTVLPQGTSRKSIPIPRS